MKSPLLPALLFLVALSLSACGPSRPSVEEIFRIQSFGLPAGKGAAVSIFTEIDGRSEQLFEFAAGGKKPILYVQFGLPGEQMKLSLDYADGISSRLAPDITNSGTNHFGYGEPLVDGRLILIENHPDGAKTVRRLYAVVKPR